MKTSVFPKIEFIQGIPLDLEQDSFIDPRIRNLVVLDDLMSTASKDSRINDLFTEGSHHRNLSVDVRLNFPFDGRKRFVGRLVGVEDGQALVRIEDEEYVLPLENVQRARVVPAFD